MILGIDLGTTNSLIAIHTAEGTKIIPNVFGHNLTPSIVSLDEDNNILVGLSAKERMTTHPDFTIAEFKRYMGTDKTFNLGDRQFRAHELWRFSYKNSKAMRKSI